MKNIININYAKLTAALIASVEETIITVIITGITLAYINAVAVAHLATVVPGLYITYNLVVLLRRIVQRYDDHYTTDELADLIDELRNQITRMERAA